MCVCGGGGGGYNIYELLYEPMWCQDNYPWDNYPGDNYPGDNYPIGQSPHRTTTPQPIIHHDNYPPRTITFVEQLPLKAIAPIAKTTTPKDNKPLRKVFGHNFNCTIFIDWE